MLATSSIKKTISSDVVLRVFFFSFSVFVNFNIYSTLRSFKGPIDPPT